MAIPITGGAAAPSGQEQACIVQRDDGVWLRTDVRHAALQAAAGAVFLAGDRFDGLEYTAFLHTLYGIGPKPPASPGTGPKLPAAPGDEPLVRVADAIVPFPPARRQLYKSVKIVAGAAEYFFEPVFDEAGDGEEHRAALSFDEFAADMWLKGIRFGIAADAVREAIDSGRRMRIVVARRLDPVAGRDAEIVEVSQHIHRSNAPRALANGRFDLHTFENRFPQVKAHVPLLRKEPGTAGTCGFELSGMPTKAKAGRDVELTRVAGTGTVIVHLEGHDHLVSAVEGFINVDRKSGRLSIGAKIVGREGVSVRTTGNLQLTGEYEEFGEVQENRIVEGGNITIHGDVFGHVASRGGTVQLRRNLMGGSAVNAAGAIRVAGVASNAVLQAKGGTVTIRHAENCVITAASVTIGEATNCEILADEVAIGIASGCAIAGRAIVLDGAGPRKGSEMLLFALVPDTRRYDEAIADLAGRIERCGGVAAAHQAAIDTLTARDDVRGYLALSARVRAREVTLTAAQRALFDRMARQLGPALTELAQQSVAGNAAQAQRTQLQDQLAKLRERRGALAARATCRVKALAGDTTLRAIVYQPDAGPPCDLAPKEVKAALRAAPHRHAAVLHAAHGAIDWSSPP